MKITKLITGAVAALALTTTVAMAAQDPKTPQKPADITVTGCVIQGSQPSVFILDNARMNASDKMEQGKRYVLVSKVEDMPLQNLTNHEVTVTGTSGDRDPSLPDQERALPVLTARTMSTLADRCTTTR